MSDAIFVNAVVQVIVTRVVPSFLFARPARINIRPRLPILNTWDAFEYSVEQGQDDGEFTKKLTPRMIVDMLFGPVFFRLMSHGQDLDDDFRENFPQDIVRMISA